MPLTREFKETVQARIKAVLRRRAPEAAQEMLSHGALELDPVAHRVTAAGATVDLGPTEFRLLKFLMARPDRVHTRTQLLDQVWGDHVYIEERTIDVHIRRLRLALEPHGQDHMIETEADLNRVGKRAGEGESPVRERGGERWYPE